MKTHDNSYALYEYTTENVGDEVQSIAARRFLPRVDYYINRDEIKNFTPKPRKTAPKLIMNAWYMHKPENWPPVAGTIDPLLISMYVDQKNPHTVEAFTSPESREFFENYGPVGARDKATQKFLQKQGIDSYFSGCVTLTLQRDKRFSRGDFVLLVDVSPEIEEAVRKSTKRPVVSLSVYRTPYLSREDKFTLAEYYLYLYQSAHSVVTTRLHTMLPCLAFETPVALIKEKNKFEPKRYEGLVDLVHSFGEQEYIKDTSVYSVDRPPKNKPDYKLIRNELISKCKEFTGYEAETYLTISLDEIYKNPSFMGLVGAGSTSTYRELLRIGDAAWLDEVAKDLKKQLRLTEKELSHKNGQLSETKGQLEAVYGSSSWKITAPLRIVKKVLRGKSHER